MLYQFIVTMNKRVVKQMYFSLLEYSHALMHKEFRFVCDGRSVSATVGVCPLGAKTKNNVITQIFYQLNTAMNFRVVPTLRRIG